MMPDIEDHQTGTRIMNHAENKQIEIQFGVKDQHDNIVGEYGYDGDGRRIKKIVPSTGEVTVFVYSAGGQLVAEYSTVQPTTQKVSYTTADHLGSPRILTDENGATISRRDFHPFGEEITTPDRTSDFGYQPDDVRQKFTTYERDSESDLDFAQARYYKPSHGRFTSVDPLMASARVTNPKTWNRYTYALNNPLKYIDPDGMDVNILDDNARELVLLTLSEKIREKVKAAIEKGNGKLTKGALNKIKSKDENFLALKFLVDHKEVTEAATSDTGVVKFFMTTWEKINEADEKAAAEREGITVEEAKKKNTNRQLTGPTGYLGQTYSQNGEDGVPRSPSGNLRAVATDGTGEGITKENAVVTMAHELYGHAYLFRRGDKNWHVDSENPNTFIGNVEQRTLRNYRGEQKKDVPKNLKPKQ